MAAESHDLSAPEPAQPVDETWVYDLDAKPWGVAEVQGKKLSLRHDGQSSITRRFVLAKVVPGGTTGKTTVEIGLHHYKATKSTLPSAPLLLTKLKVGDWVRIELDSDETLQLFKHLENLTHERVVRGVGNPLDERAVELERQPVPVGPMTTS